ncbi:hypothetical protein F2Q69_00013880 [Brassica cretica]|uniref:Uncharacterized protein n=1 Tax=Brassica cretica TaxID=69181 RepID=A0A8S9R0P3_BRACR|nr:hypothetical protein F2Q69_00013880 [Brassica cretica]
MRRSILSWVNTCNPNNGSGSKTGPFLPPGQFRLGPSKIVSAPAIQAQGRISIVPSPIPPDLKRINPTASGTIFPIIFRPTRLTKVLLPRSCPIDLEGISKGSTEATGAISTTAHIQSISRVVHVHRTECDVVLSPTRSEHEALKSFRFQRRIIRDYEFLHDVRRYLRVVRRRIGHHASTKCLVPPGEGMTMCHRGPAPGRRISLITTMQIRAQEFLLPSAATDHLPQTSTDTSDLHQLNLRVLPSIDMQGQGPKSS